MPPKYQLSLQQPNKLASSLAVPKTPPVPVPPPVPSWMSYRTTSTASVPGNSVPKTPPLMPLYSVPRLPARYSSADVGVGCSWLLCRDTMLRQHIYRQSLPPTPPPPPGSRVGGSPPEVPPPPQPRSESPKVSTEKPEPKEQEPEEPEPKEPTPPLPPAEARPHQRSRSRRRHLPPRLPPPLPRPQPIAAADAAGSAPATVSTETDSSRELQEGEHYVTTAEGKRYVVIAL